MTKLVINTDGGSRGNPGPAAIGVILKSTKEMTKIGKYIGRTTNNVAEYSALIEALKAAKGLKATELECLLDSELVVKQLNGQYRLENPKIQQFFIEIWNLKFDFKSIKFKHIPRERNREADRLVNKALDAEACPQKLF